MGKLHFNLLVGASYSAYLVNCQVSETHIVAGFAYFDGQMAPVIALKDGEHIYDVRLPQAVIDCQTYTTAINLQLERVFPDAY